ncbi:hypothetical protein [Solidesulfovibrio sp.]|uniref:hypothetical protein n=1 Tax=Solidesulfovibrio sp. TaxID=2910990 RepID=UPI00261229F9|nr:hypothetical protein [Solidesulfovibrio sp.]
MVAEENGCRGGSLAEFLEEDGTLEACEAVAVKRVIAWQLRDYMEACCLTKTEMARRLGTSRSLVDRILDENNTSITLGTILKVGRVIHKPVRFSFSDGEPHCAV